MKRISNRSEYITEYELELIKGENEKTLLTPLKIISVIAILSGLFALLFEVRYFHEVSIYVYTFRFYAIAAAFWILIVSNLEFGRQHAALLVHLLLIAIILSFGAVIIFIPNMMVINSQIAALTIFTSAIFLGWEAKHQIIVAIYYNLIFGITILVNRNQLYFIDNIFMAVLFVMFLSVMSIAAVSVNYHLRRESLIKTLRIRESQKKYKEIFDNSLEGLFQATADGKIIAANRAFYKLLGIEETGNESNVNLFENTFLSREDIFSISSTLLEDKNIINHTLKLKIGDTEKTCQLSCKIRTDLITNSYIIEGSLRDITLQVKSEEALRFAKEKAEESDRLKSEFLSQISHEIRTPINAILSSVEFLRDELKETLSEDAETTFKIIDSASKRIIRTIHLVLNLAEVQSGVYQYMPSRFDLYYDCLLLVYHEYENIIREKEIGLKLSRNIDNAVIVADEHSVNQIFKNIIDNAVKYTHYGNIDVVIERDDKGRLCVEVNDSGIGISEEFFPHLYRAFTQEEQGFTRKFEGNGLGLALVKKYCELNNAEITITSQKSVGTSVKVVFLNTKEIALPV